MPANLSHAEALQRLRIMRAMSYSKMLVGRTVERRHDGKEEIAAIDMALDALAAPPQDVAIDWPDPFLTADEFEAAYAQRSKMTVAELRALGRVVRPCHCGEAKCIGWAMLGGDALVDYDARFPAQIEPGWRTMESAPKDGTRILACAKSSRGKWLTSVIQWEIMLTPEEGDTADWVGWRWHAGNGTPLPTHWMPLPPSPTTETLK